MTLMRALSKWGSTLMMLVLLPGYSDSLVHAQDSSGAGQTEPGLLPDAPWSDWVNSDQGHYRLRYRAGISPLRINTLHSWQLQLEDAEGRPVEEAEFAVSGGMPAHDHGLATAPSVAPTGEPGQYRLSGLRFHMPGEWEVTLAVTTGHQEDDIRISLRL